MGVPRYPKQRTFVHQLGGGGGFEVNDTLTVCDLLTITKTSVYKTLTIYLLGPHLKKTLLILTLEKGYSWRSMQSSNTKGHLFFRGSDDQGSRFPR